MALIKVDAWQCERCGHIWIARRLPPRVCPRCKSPYWDRPRARE